MAGLLASRRVVTPGIPGMTATDAAHALARSPEGTVFFDGLKEILAAAGMKPAQRRQQRPQTEAVKVDAADQEQLQDKRQGPEEAGHHDWPPSRSILRATCLTSRGRAATSSASAGGSG